MTQMTPEDIIKEVEQSYSKIARNAGNEITDIGKELAEKVGYSKEDLKEIPIEANMGLSCGNPVAIASLKEGEIVVDMGCGGGMDVFLASKKVGPKGKVIGIDMSADMIHKAQSLAEKREKKNVEFHLSFMDEMPVDDNFVDCVISNCVVNLTPDKMAVYKDVFRILKPGGRIAISDPLKKKPLPDILVNIVGLVSACIAGALQTTQVDEMLHKVGFQNIKIINKNVDMNIWRKKMLLKNSLERKKEEKCSCQSRAKCCTSSDSPKDLTDDTLGKIEQLDFNDYLGSFTIEATKPL